jgi:hypothetical protein
MSLQVAIKLFVTVWVVQETRLTLLALEQNTSHAA